MKYSDEFRKELHDLAGQGYSTSAIGKMYGINEGTIGIILAEHWEREKRLTNKKLMGELHGRQESQSSLDKKDLDSRQYNIWCYKFKQKLKGNRTYNNLQVVHIGGEWFTVKSTYGYNKTIHFNDLFNKLRG